MLYIRAQNSSIHKSFLETRASFKHKKMIKEDPGLAPVTSTVVHIHSETVQPDYVTWSTFNTVFMNSCCLGFLAYVYSVKSRDRKMVGDVIGAQTYASTAKQLNIGAVVVSVITFIIIIIVCSIAKRGVP